jgi:hypothetical protein
MTFFNDTGNDTEGEVWHPVLLLLTCAVDFSNGEWFGHLSLVKLTFKIL